MYTSLGSIRTRAQYEAHSRVNNRTYERGTLYKFANLSVFVAVLAAAPLLLEQSPGMVMVMLLSTHLQIYSLPYFLHPVLRVWVTRSLSGDG